MTRTNLPARAPSNVDHIQVPAMPTVEKHRARLSPSPSSRLGDSGERIEGFDFTISVTRSDALIPIEDCRSIVEEVDRASVPASAAHAARFAKMLIGAFHARQLADAEIFATTLRAAFMQFPADIGLQAVEKLVHDGKWSPSISEAFEALEGLMARRQHARLVAQRHLQMHEEIELERAEEARHRAELEEIRPYLRIVHKFQARFSRGRDVTHPRWRLGVVDPQWCEAVERWVAAFGVAEVERWHQSIADMPKPPADGIMAALERLAGEAEKRRELAP